MSKIIKLIILVILLAIFGKYIYQYLKRNGKNLFSFTEKAGSFIKRSVVKSIDAVGIGDTVKKVEAKLSPTPTPPPPAPSAPVLSDLESQIREVRRGARPRPSAPPSFFRWV